MNKVLKRIGIGLGALVGLLVVAAIAMYFIGSSNFNQPSVEVDSSYLLSSVTADSASVARGAHYARIHGCLYCHGEDLGGKTLIDAPPFRIVTANLTSGAQGLGATYTATDFDRAIRYGTRKDGSRVFPPMPSKAYHNLTDQDTADLIAFIMSVDPVDSEHPKSELRFLGHLISAMDPSLGSAHLPPTDEAPPIRQITAGPTVEYGNYIAKTGCADCHGPQLIGGENPDPNGPPVPSLAAASTWSFEQFANTLRTGTTPAGVDLRPEFMPWTEVGQMTDDEMKAIHLYIQSLF